MQDMKTGTSAWSPFTVPSTPRTKEGPSLKVHGPREVRVRLVGRQFGVVGLDLRRGVETPARDPPRTQVVGPPGGRFVRDTLVDVRGVVLEPLGVRGPSDSRGVGVTKGPYQLPP